MRKRNVSYLIDKLFWTLILILPLIVWVAIMIQQKQFIGLTNALIQMNLFPKIDNSIYTTLLSVFGENGVLPLLQTPDILLYFSYYVIVNLIHLFIDFLLFIPKIAMSWLDGLYKLGGTKND